MNVHALVGPPAVDFIRDHWADLYRQDPAATPYQSPEWLIGWASRLNDLQTPVILVVAGSEGPVAALALVRRTATGGRSEIVPLSAPHAEYVRVIGPAAEEPQAIAALTSALDDLALGGDHVALRDVPATSALGQHLMKDGRWPQTAVPCARVPLPLDLMAMSKATRKAHRRRERALDELVAKGHRILYRRTQTSDELTADYKVLHDLHRRQWPADIVRPESDLTLAADDWPSVLDRCGPDIAFVASMEVDDCTVAAQLCLYRGHHCYSLRLAMDLAYRDLSPGHSLLRLLAADLAESGFTHLDLGPTIDTPEQIGYKAQYLPNWTYTLTATHAALLNSSE